MPVTAKQIEELRDIVTAAGVLERTSTDFRSHTLPWSLSYDRSPELAVIPSSLEQLQQAVKYLYDSDLEFAVRGKGVGSASASHVVLSLRAFQDVLFDGASLTVQIDAGLDWGQVDTKLATLAPGYVVVGARCPYVGVAGSTLTGGLSWLSHELGLGSDPTNLLDAQIVLADGRIIWATEEPDLMWALRGGGGNFGVVANLKMRAHKYTSTIFSGMIRYPAESLYELSAAVANWVRTSPDPKMAMHLFVFDFSARTLHGEAVKPELIALIFDSHGERHARSGKGFQWAFELHGAQPDVREMALPEVHELQRSTESTHGTAETWLEAALISGIDDQTVVRAYHWYENIANNEPDLALGTFALLEVMQEPAFSSSDGPKSTAWPHGHKGRQHVLQLSTGGPVSNKAQSTILKERAFKVLQEAPSIITGKAHPPGNFLPNFLLEFHDPAQIYGDNYERLREIKTKYDPKGRFFRAGFDIPRL